MNDNSLNNLIERLSKLIKSKNILIGVILFMIVNIFFIEHHINHENRDLLITNYLYYLNKLNLETISNKNLNNPIMNQEKIIGDANKNKNNVNPDAQLVTSENEEIDKKLVSIKSIEICSKACDGEMELLKGPCLNQCLKDYEAAQNKDKVHSQYVFILFVILIAFICSFFSYMKKNLYKLEANKDYSNFIQHHLLEGYDLIDE